MKSDFNRPLFHFCRNCGKQLTREQNFCSRHCASYSRRGTGKSHIRIRVGGKRVYLHRHLVETCIRPLKEGEIVHHIDGDKFNNSLSNLEILDGQATHLHLHDYFRGHRRKGNSEAEAVAEYLAETAEFGF
jgi:hypothetical protein